MFKRQKISNPQIAAQYAEGIEFVLNGKMIVDSGKLTGALPGQLPAPANERK
jgi:hypothetical protein